MKKLKRYESYFSEEVLRELSISDLKGKKTGINKLNYIYKLERNKIMGPESRVSKYIQSIYDKKEDSLTVYFLTEPTKKYPKNYKYKQVDYDTLQLKDNPSKTYEFRLKFFNFMKFLSTSPEEGVISEQDIIDALEVADLKYFDGNPSWQFMGGNYFATQLGISLRPENRYPKKWVPIIGEEDYFLMKHLKGILDNMPFYARQILMSVKKELGLTKKS
jgi:hypothetical protein